MSTEDVAREAAAANTALLALSKAGKQAAKKRKDEIEEARKRQSDIEYGALLAKRAEQDVIEKAEEVLSQIDPDLDEPKPEPTPVVKPEPKPVDEPKPEPTPVVKPEPKPVEKEVPDHKTERKLQEESERADNFQRKLNDAERKLEDAERKLKDCEEEKVVTKVTTKPPEQPRKPTATDRANPFNWGWISWLLAIIGLILGWTVLGEWLEVQSQPSLWDWVAWLFRPASAAVGFFGGGLIGHFIAEKRANRSTRA